MTFQSSLVNRPHCSFAFPTNWFQLPLIWSVFIFDLRTVNPILSTASVGFEFPQGFQSLWRLSRPICEDHKARCFIPASPALRYHTIKRSMAFAALPSVIGGPGSAFIGAHN